MVAASTSGCFAFVTKEEGRELKQQIDDVRTLSAKNELRAAELAKELDEQLYANAIGAYTKVVDNFPKSDVVPDAMYKNGLAFYALKYCGDAKVYFQELLKRYPRTSWKSQATEELKKLVKDQKNKAVCA